MKKNLHSFFNEEQRNLASRLVGMSAKHVRKLVYDRKSRVVSEAISSKDRRSHLSTTWPYGRGFFSAKKKKLLITVCINELQTSRGAFRNKESQVPRTLSKQCTKFYLFWIGLFKSIGVKSITTVKDIESDVSSVSPLSKQIISICLYQIFLFDFFHRRLQSFLRD